MMDGERIIEHSEDPRFRAILATCLEKLERGETLDHVALLQRHPEYAESLRRLLDDQRLLRQVVTGMPGNAGQGGSLRMEAADATIDSPSSANDIVEGMRIKYIGEYEILEEIARGGMGIVFKAKQRNLKRIVALKMIRSGHLATDADVRRFQIEAQAAGRLHHPRIVAIHEVGEHEGHHYFTMDYIAGRSLADAIRGESLPARRAAELVSQAAEAIQFAHDQGTLHRDLKPANILLDPDGNPKITDFGLAKLASSPDDGSQATLTTTGQVLGTPGYMSPEQAAGRQHLIGPATDIYSLGAILYASLTGRAPFLADSPLETLLQVMHQEPVPPRALNPKIPRDLETIALKCLAKQPSGRYATARLLAEDLTRWLTGRPILAKPAGPLRRLAKWSRRHPAWTAFLLVLVVASVSMAWLWWRAERASRFAAEQLYVNRVALAEREWLVQNRPRAMELLLECDPASRGWEWRFVTRLCLATPHIDLATAAGPVRNVTFDPTGRLLGTTDPTCLRLWDARDLRLMHEIHEPITRFAFLPDGEHLAVAIGAEVRMVSPGSGQASRLLLTADAPIVSLCVDSSGEHLAALDDASTVILVKLADPVETSRFSVRDDGRMSPHRWIRFQPGSNQLFVATTYGPVRVWDPVRGVRDESVRLPETYGFPCALSEDGTRIAYNGTIGLGARKWIQVHDLRAQSVVEIPVNEDAYAVAFGPDGQSVAVALEEINLDVEDITGAQNDLAGFLGAWAVLATKANANRGMIYLYDVVTGRRGRQLRGHAGSVFFDGLAISPDGKTLGSAGGFRRAPGDDEFVGELKIWDLQDASPSLVLRGHDAEVSHVAVSADGQWIASGDTQGEVRVWRMGGQLERVLRTEDGETRGIAFADQHRQLVIADRSKMVWWNIDTGEPTRSISGADEALHPHEMRAGEILEFCGNALGDQLAFATRESVAILDGASGKLVRTIQESPSGLAFAPGQGPIAMTFYHDLHGELKTFDPATGHPGIHVESDQVGNPFRTGWGLLAATFSPDGRRVVGVGNNGPALIWDTRRGRRLLELSGHSGFIWAVAYSPDGTRIATGSWDTTIKLWDAATGRETMTLRGHEQNVRGLAFSPCGTLLVSVSDDRTVRIWNADLDRLGHPDQVVGSRRTDDD
jgi:eukaryotic-like serine/threonine-protein kinase